MSYKRKILMLGLGILLWSGNLQAYEGGDFLLSMGG